MWPYFGILWGYLENTDVQGIHPQGFRTGMQPRRQVILKHSRSSGFELAHASDLGSFLSRLYTELGLPETYQPPRFSFIHQNSAVQFLP